MSDRQPAGLPVALGLGIGVIGVVSMAILVAVESTDYNTWGALVLAPLLVVVSLPILSRQAKRENDRRLFWLLVAALVLKLGGALVRDYIAFDVYGGQADAAVYHAEGARISEQFRDGMFETGLDNLTGGNFIRFVTGMLYTITGPTRLGGFVFYSWLGFWGLFLFYRAFTVAVPHGRSRTYAHLLFFLPSLLFWPSSIGKEAWMMFTLGIAAYGAARILSGMTVRGVTYAGLGMWLAAMVRPHMAGLVALSLVVGILLRRPRASYRPLAFISKLALLAVVVVASVVLVNQTAEFFESSGFETGGGVTGVLKQTAERTGSGGSSFEPSILQSPARAPIAIVTVLFRPFLFEAGSAAAAAAALEVTFLLALTVVRFPWFLSAIRSVREQPYVGLSLVYTGLIVLAFSSIANFGLLARERVQLFPFYLVLFSIPPRKGAHAPKHAQAEWRMDAAVARRSL
ncbi:MAG: hypothetical protein ACRDH8_14580 [Actinomycetota bacterium]